MDFAPQAKVLSSVGEDGRVTLLVPKFKSRTLQRVLLKCKLSTHVRVRLDEFGSGFWNLVDGSRSIGEIGQEMQIRFGESVQPVYERLAVFILQMKSRGYITLTEIKPD